MGGLFIFAFAIQIPNPDGQVSVMRAEADLVADGAAGVVEGGALEFVGDLLPGETEDVETAVADFQFR